MKKKRNAENLVLMIVLVACLFGLLLVGISFKLGILKDLVDVVTIIAYLLLPVSLILLISTCCMVYKDRKNKKDSQEGEDEF